jgi:hypothetical protein
LVKNPQTHHSYAKTPILDSYIFYLTFYMLVVPSLRVQIKTNYYQKDILMTAKQILFSVLILGAIGNAALATEENQKAKCLYNSSHHRDEIIQDLLSLKPTKLDDIQIIEKKSSNINDDGHYYFVEKDTIGNYKKNVLNDSLGWAELEMKSIVRQLESSDNWLITCGKKIIIDYNPGHDHNAYPISDNDMAHVICEAHEAYKAYRAVCQQYKDTEK